MMRISPMLRARARERESDGGERGGRERGLPLSPRRKLHTRPARVAKISTGSTVLNSKEHNIRQKTWSSLRLTRLTTNHPQRSPFQDSIVSRTRDPRRTDTDKQTQTHSITFMQTHAKQRTPRNHSYTQHRRHRHTEKNPSSTFTFILKKA